MSDFSALGLPAELTRAVRERGYVTPTPIQREAIPLVLARRDLIARAETGTGKTAAFTLPILALLRSATRRDERSPRALILTPTRELAAQVAESVALYGRHGTLRALAIFGGVDINPQIAALARGVDILVATPGRLLDHARQGTVGLSKIEILILDEADRMLDMGFIHDIRRVLAALPSARQNLLFSATFPPAIRRLAADLLADPAAVDITQQTITAAGITQEIVLAGREQKRALLVHLFETRDWSQALVFTRTKHLANRLAEYLEKRGISARAIHGNKSQTARTRALGEFKSGTLRALVATDIAARGIDISHLPQVVNYELPMLAEDYVHRIGRTARGGAAGRACSLVCVDEYRLLEGIERLVGHRFERRVVAGYEPDSDERPVPIETGRGSRRDPRSSPDRPSLVQAQRGSARSNGSRPRAPDRTAAAVVRGSGRGPRRHDG